MRLLACALSATLVVACPAPPRVTVLGKDEQPEPAGPRVRHAHREGSIELPEDEEVVEPDHPLVDTPAERALAHVHTPQGACSGAVLTARVVVTAAQCLRGGAKGTFVEVASGSMTWTRREVAHAVVGACEWHKLDVAALVLAQAVEWVRPLRVTTAPSPGAVVQALGFGRCRGQSRGRQARVGELLRRDDDTLVVDLALCRGDLGGPLLERGETDVLGLVSHHDDAEDARRQTTTVARLDTGPARRLVARAIELAAGGAPSGPVSCE